MPGLHWHMPWPIETKQIVNIAAIDSFTEQTRMLTSDENLVDINLEVQYRRANASTSPSTSSSRRTTLKEVSESAIREVIGRSKLDSVLESGRQDIVARTQELIQRTLDAYKTGLEVTAVNLQDVRVPERSRARAGGRDQGARGPRPTVAGSAGVCERPHPDARAVTRRDRCRMRRRTRRRSSPTPKARPSAS